MDYVDIMNKLEQLDESNEKEPDTFGHDNAAGGKERSAARENSGLNFKRNVIKTNFEMHAEMCSLGPHGGISMRRGELHDFNPAKIKFQAINTFSCQCVIC